MGTNASDGQRERIAEMLRGRLRKGLGLTSEQAQQIIEHGSSLGQLLKILLTGTQKLNEISLRQFEATVNGIHGPVAEPFESYPEYTPGVRIRYPAEMCGWKEQLQTLEALYPGLSSAGLKEQAEWYLTQSEIWKPTFTMQVKIGTDVSLFWEEMEFRVWDGLLVFPHPNKVAKKLGIGDLNEEAKREMKRHGNRRPPKLQGLWQRLVVEVLFPHLETVHLWKFQSELETRGIRILPRYNCTRWLQEIEEEVAGDFHCQPFNFGSRTLGYSVTALDWYFPSGTVPVPTWINGHALITHPGRTRRASQEIGNAGDHYYHTSDDNLHLHKVGDWMPTSFDFLRPRTLRLGPEERACHETLCWPVLMRK